MASIDSFWKKILPFKRISPVDRYQVKVITSTAELSVQEYLPAEIRFVLAVRPSRFETFRKILDEGYGIGVRIVEKTPDRVLQAGIGFHARRRRTPSCLASEFIAR